MNRWYSCNTNAISSFCIEIICNDFLYNVYTEH